MMFILIIKRSIFCAILKGEFLANSSFYLYRRKGYRIMSAGERETEKDVTLNAPFLYQKEALAKVKILTENFLKVSENF